MIAIVAKKKDEEQAETNREDVRSLSCTYCSWSVICIKNARQIYVHWIHASTRCVRRILKTVSNDKEKVEIVNHKFIRVNWKWRWNSVMVKVGCSLKGSNGARGRLSIKFATQLSVLLRYIEIAFTCVDTAHACGTPIRTAKRYVSDNSLQMYTRALPPRLFALLKT